MAFPFSSYPSIDRIPVIDQFSSEQNISTASRLLTFRPEFRFYSVEISNGKDVKNDKKSRPEDITPKGRERLGEGGRHHSPPIDKLQNKNKKEEEEKEPFENLFPPQVTKPDQKEGKKFTDQMILSLKLLNLRGLLFNNLRVKFFLLNKNTIAIETNKFLI
jgi:hypothetical protein